MTNEQLVQYEATLLLRKYFHHGPKKIQEIINEIGIRSENEGKIAHWIYNENIPFYSAPSPLLKALFYNQAYNLTLKLRELSDYQIKKAIRKKLKIRVPTTTIRNWKKGKSKPRISLKICKELGYVMGVIKSDCRKSYPTLKVKDFDFASSYAKALEKVLDKKYLPHKKGGYYWVVVGISALKYIASTSLWKIIAYMFPSEFLKGFFDGDGGVNIGVSTKQLIVLIHCANTDGELIDFVEKLLKFMGILPHKYKVHRKSKDIYTIYISSKHDIEKFAYKIGFSIKRKQEKLEDALKILKSYGSGKKAIEKWMKLYYKRKGRWIKRKGQAQPRTA